MNTTKNMNEIWKRKTERTKIWTYGQKKKGRTNNKKVSERKKMNGWRKGWEEECVDKRKRNEL